MADVHRIMEQINRHCEQAHIIMGAAIDEELRDRLTVTLVASRRTGPAEEISVARALGETSEATPAGSGADLAERLVEMGSPSRPASRVVAPPPESSPAKTEELLAQQSGAGSRLRKGATRMRQGQLPLEILSKGRFEKSEPTIHRGQDLDVPTYIRRGVALN